MKNLRILVAVLVGMSLALQAAPAAPAVVDHAAEVTKATAKRDVAVTALDTAKKAKADEAKPKADVDAADAELVKAVTAKDAAEKQAKRDQEAKDSTLKNIQYKVEDVVKKPYVKWPLIGTFLALTAAAGAGAYHWFIGSSKEESKAGDFTYEKSSFLKALKNLVSDDMKVATIRSAESNEKGFEIIAKTFKDVYAPIAKTAEEAKKAAAETTK